MNPQEIALIIIDPQNDFIHEKGKYTELAKGAKPTIEPLKKVVETCHKVGIPVIYVITQFRHDYSDAGTMRRPRELGAVKIGTWGAAIIDDLKPCTEDIIVEKKRYSAFYNTDLEVVLRGLGSETLIFAGYATNICVESTVRDAKFRDFNIIVLSDCTAAGNREMHQTSLRNFESFLGSTTTSAEFIRMVAKSK